MTSIRRRLTVVALLYGLGSIWAFTVPANVLVTGPLQTPPLLSVTSILVVNLAVLLTALTGVITAGTSTVLVTLANGVSFGGMTRAFLASGHPVSGLWITLGPHFLPELLGLWVCGAVGLRGFDVLTRLVKGESLTGSSWVLEFKAIGVGVALTIVGAFVEGLITLPLVTAYLNR